MVNLLYGDYGSGKSTYIIEKIKEDCQRGIPSFLIVPEQETVIAERQIATELEPRAQLYCEVTNFTRLANRVFRDFGGLKYNYISKSAKSLVMYRAICQCRENIKGYKIEKGHEKSCIAMFLQAINELKTYAVSIGSLEAALEKIKDEHLRNKLENIITIWPVYESILAERYCDPLDDAAMLARLADKKEYFKGYNVYIDSFYGFTQSQFEIIYFILRDAKNVTIAFDCPSGTKRGQMQYAKISESVYRIKELLADTESYIPKECSFDKDQKHKGKDLAYIYKNIWNFSAPPKTWDKDVNLALCPDEFSECEYACSRIKELIFNGDKYSDIAIIARNLSSYRGILDFTLKKYDIPYFFSLPSDLLGRPVVKMLFNALSAIVTYKAEDILSYVKCGYTDIDRQSEALLEEYIYRWGIYGRKFCDISYWASNPDGFAGMMSPEQEAKLTRILEAREAILSRLEILARAFSKNATVKDCAKAVVDFLNAHNVLEKLEKEKSEATKADAYIIVQMWEALLSSLDTIVDVCGDTTADPQAFASLLHYALLDAELSTIPTGEDNVLVAEASMVRARGIKHVFILGANEGVFPASVSDDSFFNDKDKSILKGIEGISIKLSESSSMRADDEYMFFRQSLAIASRSATVSALTGTIAGEKCKLSVGFNRIKELLTGISVTNTLNSQEIDKIYSPAMAREMLGTDDPSLGAAISQVLGVERRCNSFSNTQSFIGDETIDGFFAGGRMLSQTAITTFLDCRFKFVCNYLLNLRSNKKFNFGSLEIGNLFHKVFEDILTKLRDNKDLPCDDAGITKLVEELTSDYINAICGGKPVSNKLSHLFSRMKTNLLTIVKKMVEEYRQGAFEPAFFELSFRDKSGTKSAPPLEIPLSDGTSICLYGSADKIDVYRDENNTYVRVVDYKTGSKTFSMAQFNEGIQLQLFVYLFGLCKMKSCDFKTRLLDGRDRIVPAGAYYMPLNIDKLKADKETSIDDSSYEAELLKSNALPSGRFLDDEAIVFLQDKNGDGTYLPRFVAEGRKAKSSSYISEKEFDEMYDALCEKVASVVTSMKNGDVAALPREDSIFKCTCDFCEFQPVCRRRK
ncbi:MAG: PD-(D/E)XK nuclease family protein [Clostridia bacterium]|nr:PD-(D/E)XK nuclease family protein [Clostridia bacterium]